uniref:Uncharacterized protein n=1 Tax=Lepeophtheirus salmonis TaxID=72036 RepID=A0A0K2VDH3_LEPSM
MGLPKVCPEEAKSALVSLCLNMTVASRLQYSPSQTTVHTSPVSPSPSSPKAETSCELERGEEK